MVDGGRRTGHGAVDAFGGDERGAVKVGRGEGDTEFIAEGGGIDEREETLVGGNGVLGGL
jgi:hypothetical protein